MTPEEIECLKVVKKDYDALSKALMNPDVVWINMQRGVIAIPNELVIKEERNEETKNN